MLMPSLFGENLFDDFFDDFARPTKHVARCVTPSTAVMKTDIKENEEGFELAIDLPGYKKEDVQAELKDGYLTITATRKSEEENSDKKSGYLRRERYFGTSSRSFYVGEALEEGDIKAKFADGVLHVAVPKKEVKPQVEEKKLIAIEG
ncbi:MAG: Hsp20/alpha crystallin family protein [Lachnospiraceae bacterium]|jgi:HSP20 family molecular chaperone IbpA|nr:Hsp20/alpha crystallin family protein [Lachnospiraceae bacterium]